MGDYDNDDNDDEMQEDDDESGSPPWRRGRRTKMGSTGGCNHARRSENGDGMAGGSGEAASGNTQGMDWAAQGTERTRTPKRDVDGQAREVQHEVPGQSQQAREAQQLAETAMEQARAARREARRQRGLDMLRGQVQIEKNNEIERRQKEAGCNVVKDAQEWTPEQLAQNSKIVEQINKEFEQKAEERFATMSEEEIQQLLGDLDGPYW